MDRTFNNGLGMILIVGQKHVDGVSSLLRKMHERHFMVGEIKKGKREVNFVS
jgi:phosphoribosylaminoimidazole (AIR) synthetase